jgi:multidrug efflux pump subunit AcrB
VECRNDGQTPQVAMFNAVRDRFRPIVLSSVTTLFGLAPLIFSNSIHAAPLQPVANSMGFGMLFSIPVILILLPCFGVALDAEKQKADDSEFGFKGFSYVRQ